MSLMSLDMSMSSDLFITISSHTSNSMRSLPSTQMVSSVIRQKRRVGREAGRKGRTLKRRALPQGSLSSLFRRI